MGIESYFFSVEFKDILTTEEVMSVFEKKYNVLPYMTLSGNLIKHYHVWENCYVLDNKAVIHIYEPSKITFDLCFSNFETNLIYMYGVLRNILPMGERANLIIYNKKHSFEHLNVEEFKYLLKDANKDKFNTFKRYYGDLEFDTIPNDFYRYFRRFKIKNRIKRFFKK